jgi:hypothetical protein
MTLFLIIAGLGQIGLGLASLAVPKVLKWEKELARMKPITRQIYTTYAVYIWAINLSFGFLSLLRPEWLLDPHPLARAVSGFIAVYWGARLLIQFFYYDRSIRPPGAFWVLAEWMLVALFTYLTALYGYLAFFAR